MRKKSRGILAVIAATFLTVSAGNPPAKKYSITAAYGKNIPVIGIGGSSFSNNFAGNFYNDHTCNCSICVLCYYDLGPPFCFTNAFCGINCYGDIACR